MTNYDDPYRAYVEGSVFTSDPVRLVVALYEGALDAVRQARRGLETGDIWGRAKAVSKAINILTELITSLDHSVSNQMTGNLARLYNYMQRKLMEGHAKKSASAFEEVEKLLNPLLDAWHVVAEQKTSMPLLPGVPGREEEETFRMVAYEPASVPYADYFAEPADRSPELVLLF